MIDTPSVTLLRSSVTLSHPACGACSYVDVLCLLTELGAMTELLCRFFDWKLKRLQINGHRKEARSDALHSVLFGP